LSAGSVETNSITANAVTSAKIASNSILSRHIANNSIVGADISATTQITASTFTGALTGDVTGNVVGNLTGTIQTAAQTNITSVGTLSALTVSGNVGIGTNSPNSYSNLTALTLNGTNGSVADFEVNGTLSGEIFAESNSLKIDALGSSGVLKLLTNSSERLTIDSLGNVGIGTTNPNNYSGYTTLTLNNATNGAIIDFELNGTLVGEIYTEDSNTFSHQAVGARDINFRTNGSERLRIDSSGVVYFGPNGSTADPRINRHSNGYDYINSGNSRWLKVGASSGHTNVAFQDGSSGITIFETAGTERMRISSGGDVSIGQPSPEANHRLFVEEAANTRLLSKFKASGEHAFVYIDSAHSNTYLPVLIFQRAGTAYGATGLQRASNGYTESTMDVKTYASHPVTISTNDTKRFTVDASGNIGAPTGTNIYNASDERLKQNISTLSNSLDVINALNPVQFNWIDNFEESENGKNLYGFVAQEVQDVFPDAVESFGTGDDIEVDGTVIQNPLTVRDKFFIPVLVKALQEQQIIIDDLKSRIETLEE